VAIGFDQDSHSALVDGLNAEFGGHGHLPHEGPSGPIEEIS